MGTEDHRVMTPKLARIISCSVIVLSVLFMARLLPLEGLMAWMTGLVGAWGWKGPLIYGIFYILCALLFVPGSALTLAAGALFGLGWGTVVVSAASTLAASLSFLIGRHLARDVVRRWTQCSPRFAAIDQAIGKGGWRVIALLRLSPAVPFSLGNYMFGLTPIPFRPYLVASWISMLPGTFMYVYLGYAGREGLASVGTGPQEKTLGEWLLMVLGLMATIIVTVYVTRLARKAMQENTTMPTTQPQSVTAPTLPRPTWNLSTITLMLAALVSCSLTACAYSHREWVARWFGPPAVSSEETYADTPGGVVFDHSGLDALLRRHVDAKGTVDYAGLLKSAGELDAHLKAISEAPLEKMDRNQRLAFLINAYNACTLRLILDHYPVASIKDIPAAKRWDAARWNVGGKLLSLTQIEHEEIRPHFKEPRIHFALVCAARGCPPLRAEAYESSKLEFQLDQQARYVHTHPAWFEYDDATRALKLTSLYQWYRGDFEGVAGSIERFAAPYSPALLALLARGEVPRITFLDYDWSLNDVSPP